MSNYTLWSTWLHSNVPRIFPNSLGLFLQTPDHPIVLPTTRPKASGRDDRLTGLTSPCTSCTLLDYYRIPPMSPFGWSQSQGCWSSMAIKSLPWIFSICKSGFAHQVIGLGPPKTQVVTCFARGPSTGRVTPNTTPRNSGMEGPWLIV